MEQVETEADEFTWWIFVSEPFQPFHLVYNAYVIRSIRSIRFRGLYSVHPPGLYIANSTNRLKFIDNGYMSASDAKGVSN